MQWGKRVGERWKVMYIIKVEAPYFLNLGAEKRGSRKCPQEKGLPKKELKEV